ncbi:hypothetical protein E2C01_063696 [Portunus trituberculatus]|uniref:Uncharacterized protein n=1 Tax=Portunus trituberculatus TaxID=210409 RepID=A0A5B7HB57_PORTR|nr:hypothetical protein [Portunus trituberculatus]
MDTLPSVPGESPSVNKTDILQGTETLYSLEGKQPRKACVTSRVRGNTIKTFLNLERPGGDSGLGRHRDTTRTAAAAALPPPPASGSSAGTHTREKDTLTNNILQRGKLPRPTNTETSIVVDSTVNDNNGLPQNECGFSIPPPIPSPLFTRTAPALFLKARKTRPTDGRQLDGDCGNNGM